jgi:iron complex transport system substrate-binding protein
MGPALVRKACLVLPALIVAGCADRDPPIDEAGRQAPLALVDDEGRTVALPAPAHRIVSLVPSATGILRALEAGDLLVGRTDFDTDPALAHLPSVGGGLGASVERIVALEPDLVIRFAAESDRATPRHLDAAGIPHLAVRPDRIRDIRRIVEILGDVAGRPEQADSLVRVMDRELDEVAERVGDAPTPRVAFLLGGDPPYVAGPGTFLNELLEVAGARNVFGDLASSYASVSVEEVARREVDLILTLQGSSLPSSLQSLPVRRVPDEVQSPGHRVGASARTLARILHPERFP